MRKAAKRKAGSKAGGRKRADSKMAESTTQEEIQPLAEEKEKEKEIGGELKDHEDEDKKNGKRKRITSKESENNDGTKADPRAKRSRARKSRQEEQIDYFEEKRSREDLWKTAFPVGMEWVIFDQLYAFNWNFKHLEEAFEEGGILHGKKVFVFVSPEAQYIKFNHVEKAINIPTVVVVESPSPPSDKLVVTSIQGASETIIPMKEMKMEWVPYIPFDKRDRRIDRMDFQIFCLVCTQRRSALKHLNEYRVNKFNYCLPYFYDPFKEDSLEENTEIQIIYPSEPPVACEFDWKFDKLEDFVNERIEDEELSADQKDEFKEFVKEQVREAKKAIREAKAARLKAIEEISEEEKEVLENIKFYKFYPQISPDVPAVLRTPYINRYYGKAHQVL